MKLKEDNTRYERELQRLKEGYQEFEVEEKRSVKGSLLQSAAAGTPCGPVVDWKQSAGKKEIGEV